VVLAGEIEHGPPFLIRRHVAGDTLSSLSAEAVDDAVLGLIWQDVALLGHHHIAHHGLRANNILIDTDGRPRIINFTLSRVGGRIRAGSAGHRRIAGHHGVRGRRRTRRA